MSHLKPPSHAILALALVLAVSACSETPTPDANGPAPVAAGSAAADVQAAREAHEAPPAAVAAQPHEAPPGAAAAQPGHPMVGPMPTLGGGMQALAELCGGSDAAELRSLKQQQRELAIQSGMSGAQFDADYDKGYNDTVARIRQGTPAEREKACAQMRELEEFGRQMEQREAARQG